eukprot:scaffold999_cov289-Pinguiococcus_pyrenoidosus.AAC.5
MEYYDENEDRIERAQAVRELIMSKLVGWLSGRVLGGAGPLKKKANAGCHATTGLSFTVLFLFLGTAVFYETNRDRDWSALDALYFSMVRRWIRPLARGQPPF